MLLARDLQWACFCVHMVIEFSMSLDHTWLRVRRTVVRWMSTRSVCWPASEPRYTRSDMRSALWTHKLAALTIHNSHRNATDNICLIRKTCFCCRFALIFVCWLIWKRSRSRLRKSRLVSLYVRQGILITFWINLWSVMVSSVCRFQCHAVQEKPHACWALL